MRAECSQEGGYVNVIRIPNPKDPKEEFKFTFNGVYGMETTQEELFTNEGTAIDGFGIIKLTSSQSHPPLSLFFKVSMLPSLHTVLRKDIPISLFHPRFSLSFTSPSVGKQLFFLLTVPNTASGRK